MIEKYWLMVRFVDNKLSSHPIYARWTSTFDPLSDQEVHSSLSKDHVYSCVPSVRCTTTLESVPIPNLLKFEPTRKWQVILQVTGGGSSLAMSEEITYPDQLRHTFVPTF